MTFYKQGLKIQMVEVIEIKKTINFNEQSEMQIQEVGNGPKDNFNRLHIRSKSENLINVNNPISRIKNFCNEIHDPLCNDKNTKICYLTMASNKKKLKILNDGILNANEKSSVLKTI